MVAVGVLFNLFDARYHDIFNFGAVFFITLDLGAGQGHPVAIVFNINISDIYEIKEPLHGKIHGLTPFRTA